MKNVYFALLALVALGCDSGDSTGPVVVSSSSVEQLSSVLLSSSIEIVVPYSSLIVEQSSSSMIQEVSSSSSEFYTFTVSPQFGGISQTLNPGTWLLSYSSQCTSGTLVLTGAVEGSSCNFAYGSISGMDVEYIELQGRPSEITLSSQCTVYCH